MVTALFYSTMWPDVTVAVAANVSAGLICHCSTATDLFGFFGPTVTKSQRPWGHQSTIDNQT